MISRKRSQGRSISVRLPLPEFGHVVDCEPGPDWDWWSVVQWSRREAVGFFSQKRPGPSGRFLIAFKTEEEAVKFRREFGLAFVDGGNLVGSA